MQNTFKNNTEPITNREREIEETIHRPANEFLKRNPPVFEDAKVDMWKKNLKLLNSIERVL